MWSSRSCFASTGDGALAIRSTALAVFGKAITSRIDDSPARMATIRSRPRAMPPCGGVPYSSASRKKPKRSFVDSHAAAADFGSVEHQVVGLRAHLARLALELVPVLVVRRGERMVHRVPAAVFRAVLEQRKVGDPEELELLRVQQVLLLRDRETQLTEQLRRVVRRPR